jgi:hypothetical protein
MGRVFARSITPSTRRRECPAIAVKSTPALKIYDSATDAKARLTAHSAFDDPNTSPNAPPRRSIEVRAILFW